MNPTPIAGNEPDPYCCYPNYIMVYRVEEQFLTILRVIHAAQIWPAMNREK